MIVVDWFDLRNELSFVLFTFHEPRRVQCSNETWDRNPVQVESELECHLGVISCASHVKYKQGLGWHFSIWVMFNYKRRTPETEITSNERKISLVDFPNRFSSRKHKQNGFELCKLALFKIHINCYDEPFSSWWKWSENSDSKQEADKLVR